MLCPPLPPSPIVEHWLARHQSVVSFSLHILAIPLTILGVLLVPISLAAFSPAILAWGISLFVAGYSIQFVGHLLEGTDPGEIILLKKRLGWSYVEFPPPERGPRFRSVWLSRATRRRNREQARKFANEPGLS